MIQTIIKGASDLGVDLSREQAERLISYKKKVIEYNEKVNLTAVTEDFDFITKHFLDSLSLIQFSLKENTLSVRI
jgi:16S rRNA (guanine527-N7)-methyltransferase